MFDLYVMYIYIGAEVNHTSLNNTGRKTQPGES